MLKWIKRVYTSIIIVFLICKISANSLPRKYNHTNVGISSATNTNDFVTELKSISSDMGLSESRGWRKTALPFLLGITLKMTALLPMITSLMTIIGGVALIASKLALFLSVGLAVHYYLVTKHQLQQYRHQSLLHSSVYDSASPITPYPVTHRISLPTS